MGFQASRVTLNTTNIPVMFLNHMHQAVYLNHIWIIYKTRGAPIVSTQAKKNSANIDKLTEIKWNITQDLT